MVRPAPCPTAQWSPHHRQRTRPPAECVTRQVEVPRWPKPHHQQRNGADPLHRLGRRRALAALLHRGTRRQGGVRSGGRTGNVGLANSWIVINVGGGPTDDKPTVTLETPDDPDRVSSFLNIRVEDITLSTPNGAPGVPNS